MEQAFYYGKLAVTLRHWFEIGYDGVIEHGSRFEIRLREEQEHRGSPFASQKLVIDRALMRGDLFDTIGTEPGSFSAAHFHPVFDGDEPCDRRWDVDLTNGPWSWFQKLLENLGPVLERSDLDPTDFAEELEAFAREAKVIVDAAKLNAPALCRSNQECYVRTRDLEGTIRSMTDVMTHPENLDHEYVEPWFADTKIRVL